MGYKYANGLGLMKFCGKSCMQGLGLDLSNISDTFYALMGLKQEQVQTGRLVSISSVKIEAVSFDIDKTSLL